MQRPKIASTSKRGPARGARPPEPRSRATSGGAGATARGPLQPARRREPSDCHSAELCSTLSHDLRNPLTVIVWSAQMLGRRVPPGEAGRHHLDAITRAAEELNQMLHELSDAARIADGRIAASLTIEPAAAADLVERAIAPTRGLVETKNLALTVEVAPELGALACDAERVVRVLAGLFGNAARRTPKGGRLAVRAQAFEGAGVRFSVEDGAPDLAPEERAALFELPAAPPPGAPRRPRAVSPAIAPYVARGVIEAHGGRIWIEGEPGRGSRFVITLPADPTPP